MSELQSMYNTPIYRTWASMIQRCTNPNNTRYKNYGGRGINVCENWRDFKKIYLDMGDRPHNTTLDRLDNNGNYCKENCEWRTPKDQSNNTSFNHLVTFNGKTRTLSQWEDVTGISQRTLYSRIVRLKWSIDRALTTKPIMGGNYGYL